MLSKRAAVFILLTAVMILLSVIFYRAVWHDIPTLVNALDHCDDLFCDFTRQYYPTGQQLFDSGQPTGGYFYTSFFAIFLAGFGRFGQSTAVSWWAIFQLVSLLLLFLPTIYFYNKRPILGLLYVGLLLLSMPVLHNLKWGQVSIFITGAVFASIYLHRRGRTTVGAIILALATAVKYYAILFALHNVVLRRSRVILILIIACLLFIVLIPLVALGWDTNLQFYQTVSERIAHTRETLIPNDPNSQYLVHVIGRFAADTWEATINPLLWQLIGFALAGSGILTASWILHRDWQEADHWYLTLLFLVLPFFTETSWPHYFVYLPFVQVFLLSQFWRQAWGWRVGGGLIILVSAVFASMPYFGWLNDRQSYARNGTLFWVNMALFLLVMAFILPRIWQAFRQREGVMGQQVEANVSV